MASTKRSAVDYIRNGTAGLVRGLRNLQLIRQALRERGLLSDSETDLIFSQDAATAEQVRRLLDAAASKGEDVCYELLRIFDDTRDQTFPMPVEQHPELHQWISCFSFGHDPQHQSDDMADSGPCAKYQRQLKTRAMQIFHEKWRQNMTFLKHKAKGSSFQYIPLVLDTDVSAIPHTKIKAYKKSKAKKLKTFIPTDKRKLSPYQLLISNEKKILLVGKPGIGKSTVVQEMLRLWVYGEDSQVSYMFYFDEPLTKLMSESAGNESLTSFLFNKYLMPAESPDVVWKDLEENSENVLIIFDGLMDIVDGSVVESLMEKEVFGDAKVLITCRPEADTSGDLSDWASFRVEIQGFSENSIRAYFKLMLETNDDTNIGVLKNLELVSLCHVPLYAFFTAACMLLSPLEANNQPCTITEMYVWMFHHCLTFGNVGDVDKYIQGSRRAILSLASTSYQAVLSKTAHLADVCLKDAVQQAFLTPVTLEGTSAFSQAVFVFLHNTVQEFWAALFLLLTPNKIGHLLQLSQTEDGKYLKYVFLLLLGLLSEKMEVYLRSLVTCDDIKSISTKYFENILNTFLYSVEDDEPDPYVEPENVLYVCQCLYEYQAPEACLLFLQKVENRLDLNDQPLDPHECCAVSYVIRQSTPQTVQLNLMNCTISDPGIKLILGSMSKLKSLRVSSASVQCQIWRVALQESGTDFDNLLRLFRFEMHLSVQEQRASDTLQNTKDVLNEKRHDKVKLCLHLDTQQFEAKSLLKNICGSLSNIADIRIISPDYPRRSSIVWKSEVDSFQMDLFLQGALHEMQTGQPCVERLLSVHSNFCLRSPSEQSNFICTLYLHAKKMGVLAVLQPVFQAWPSSWVLDPSQRKTSVVLEILKLQEVKKPVELLCSNEEHELRIFLQCLPYVSQLRFNDCIHIQVDDTKAAIKLLVDLFICASESGEDDTVKMLSTVCSYSTFPFAANMEGIQTVFLCDLFSYVRDCESQEEGKSILSAFLHIFQSVPDEWILDLSKVSGTVEEIPIILQVLKLQVVKKPIELSGWKDEPRHLEVLLQCLPYVSQLRIRYFDQDTAGAVCFFYNLLIFALENGDDETLKVLSSVCSYAAFPFADDTGEIQSAFLLELYSSLRSYEYQTGRSVHPALQPIYQSAPAVWVIYLSQQVTPVLHQAMQLQATKRPVDLRGWSNDKGDLVNFLQCLPFVSQLRFESLLCDGKESDRKGAIEIILGLFICALEKGDDALRLLSSVCSYPTFPFGDDVGEIQSIFLLDLYSCVREYESRKGESVLPALLPLYQSAPAVWVLDLSKGVTPVLHQTMQLQATKKAAELRGWTHEKNELKCFLQCLPFVSQLRFSDLALILSDDLNGAVKLLVDLFVSASESGDEILNILSSVCSYSTFPFAEDTGEIQSLFLLELHSYVGEYESQTGRSILTSLKPIYQSAPTMWVIDLSKGVMSLLHQSMQLHAVKRPVELRGWTTDESELRTILHCVPYMLHLNCSERFFQSVCEVLSTCRDWNPVEGGSLLRPLNFKVTLMEMLPRRICSAVGRALSKAIPKEPLCLSLILQSISRQGMNSLFSTVTKLQKLRMNEYATVKVSRMAVMRSQRSVTIEEISLVSTNLNLSERKLCKLMGSLASIIRVWTVRCLDLTKFRVDGRFLILLLCLDQPVSIRMSDENVHQLAEIVYETQDNLLTQCFLEKIGGDLSSSTLPWNILLYLLRKSKTPLTLDPQNNVFGTLDVQSLLPLLHSIRFSGTDSQFVRNALKEIYTSRAGHLVTNLLRSSKNWINLCEQELESYDCAALRFALHYSDEVRLNLLGTAIPKEEAESILQLLHRVTELRVDRRLLLSLLHACSVSREQNRVTTCLLTALQNKLDFSHPSTVSLFRQESRETLSLSVMDCQSISSAIQLSAYDTELIMFDCEASDHALVELLPALRNVRLSLGKSQLLQLISRIRYNEEARALSRSLGKRIDLSHTPLNSCTCKTLGLIVEQSKHLSHLNLSHCQLTDSHLNLLLPHLHKVQQVDLSNNYITDTGAQSLRKVLVRTQTVHIFNNHISDMRFFMNNRYNPEINYNWATCMEPEKRDTSKFPVTNDLEPVLLMKSSNGILNKRISTVAIFDPEISVYDDQVAYRFDCEIGGEFQCRATELVFGMKGRGCVEYTVTHWDVDCFSKNGYEPAGPQYDIKTHTGEMYLLRLPHCEAEADALGDISVAHTHDGIMEILTPVQMTSTHVTVRVSGLSTFGPVRKKGCMTRYVRAQVLLFLDRISTFEQRLWVFLLARNVSTTEIKKQHQEFTPIKTSSDCILKKKGKYCLTSSVRGYKVQPKTFTFHAASDPDYHSAFELFFASQVSELRVRIHEKRSNKTVITKWSRRVILRCNDKSANQFKIEDGTKAKENLLLTEKNWRSSLCDLFEELLEEELEKIKSYMRNCSDLAPIPRGKVEKKKERHELVDLIVETWGFFQSVKAIENFMKKLPRNDQAVTSILKPYQIQFGLIKEQKSPLTY